MLLFWKGILTIFLSALLLTGCKASPVNTPTSTSPAIQIRPTANATPFPPSTLAVPSENIQEPADTPTGALTEPAGTAIDTSSSRSPSLTKVYELVGDDCLREECLFVTETERDYPVGVATVSGYYLQIERTAWNETQVCDSFVITGGSPELIRSFSSLVSRGNTVNSKNEANQPVINLDLSVLNEAEKRWLVESTPGEPVKLIVLTHVPSCMAAPVCYSFVDILKLEPFSQETTHE